MIVRARERASEPSENARLLTVAAARDHLVRMKWVGACALCLLSSLAASARAQVLPPASSSEAEPLPAAKEEAGPRLEKRIGDLFWAEGEAGVARMGLDTLSTGRILETELLESSDSTAVWGFGAGLRALVVTVGVRFRYADFERWNIATTNLEAGFRIPIRFIEPSFTFGAGYAKLGDFDFRNAEVLEQRGRRHRRASISEPAWASTSTCRTSSTSARSSRVTCSSSRARGEHEEVLERARRDGSPDLRAGRLEHRRRSPSRASSACTSFERRARYSTW